MSDMNKSIDNKTPEDLVQRARNNHMWINAFAVINPSDEILISIGRHVVNRLKASNMRDSWGISKMEIFTFNIS